MSKYYYKCFNCGKEFDAGFIEREFIYLCPDCGKAQRNKPLEGVLTVEYDYSELRKKLKKNKFLNLAPGKFWNYPELWPVDLNIFSGEQLKRLSLTESPLLSYNYEDRGLLILDDTRNPTFSYKDRASSLTALKAIQLGIRKIAAASTGNAGSSLAGICARLGIQSIIFVPGSIPEAKRIQIQSFGAELCLVDGSYDDAFDLCLEISNAQKWYNRNTAYNPLTIEGKKSGAYDIFISSGGKIPEMIFIPVGDGVIISGIYKGFAELMKLGWIEKMPELIAVQAEGSDALLRYMKNGAFEFVPAGTIADSISSGSPRNLYMAARSVKNTNGCVISVTDSEILSAQKTIAEKMGLLTEPSSAAAFAGYLKMNNSGSIGPGQSILLLMTGNGLKDLSALQKWNIKPAAKTPSDWKAVFGV